MANDFYDLVKHLRSLEESGSGDIPIDQMSRGDMIEYLGTTPAEVSDMSDDELRDACNDQASDHVEDIEDPSYDELQSRIDELQAKLDSFKQISEEDPPDAEEIAKQNTINTNMNALKSAGLDIDVSKPADDPGNAEEIGQKVQIAMADPAMANQVKGVLSKIKD